jgi:hypothetical protein
MDNLEDLISKGDSLVVRCNKLVEDDIKGASQLLRRLKAELSFLHNAKSKKSACSKRNVQCTNLGNFKAILDAVERYPGVEAILKAYSSSKGSFKIDVVTELGFCWIKVIARNPQSIHRAWEGMGDVGERSVVDQAVSLIELGKENCRPKIMFYFANGITQPVAAALEQLGIEVDGDRVEPTHSLFAVSSSSDDDDDDEESESLSEDELAQCDPSGRLAGGEFVAEATCPQDRPLNLDITTLLTLVSSLVNGHARFKFFDPLLDEQAQWERERPMLPFLEKIMEGRKLVCMRTAFDSFKEILNIVGGPNERARGDELAARLEVLPDCLSSAAKQLRVGGKIKERSLQIFGSADHYGAITLTANRGFVIAAYNAGVKFAVILHESRALSEQKEARAVPMEPESETKEKPDEHKETHCTDDQQSARLTNQNAENTKDVKDTQG